MNVAVIGLRWDATAKVAVTAHLAGHEVVAVHLGSTDGSEMPEKTAEVWQQAPEIRLIDTSSGESIGKKISYGRAWEDLVAKIGPMDCLVLGLWLGWTEESVGEKVMDLVARNNIELIVLENPTPSADSDYQWFKHWGDERGVADLTFFRSSDHARVRQLGPGLPMTEVCAQMGLLPLDDDVLARESAALRRAGIEGLAGGRWIPVDLSKTGYSWVQVTNKIPGPTPVLPAYAHPMPWLIDRIDHDQGLLLYNYPDAALDVLYPTDNDRGDRLRLCIETEVFGGIFTRVPVAVMELTDFLHVGPPGRPADATTIQVPEGLYRLDLWGGGDEYVGLELCPIPGPARLGRTLRDTCPLCTGLVDEWPKDVRITRCAGCDAALQLGDKRLEVVQPPPVEEWTQFLTD